MKQAEHTQIEKKGGGAMNSEKHENSIPTRKKYARKRARIISFRRICARRSRLDQFSAPQWWTAPNIAAHNESQWQSFATPRDQTPGQFSK